MKVFHTIDVKRSVYLDKDGMLCFSFIETVAEKPEEDKDNEYPG